MISVSGLQPNPDHVLAVTQAPSPHDAQSLRSFLGLIAWYSKFIANYALLVELLHALLHKSADFHWTDDTQENVTRVKELITASPALALFDPSFPAVVNDRHIRLWHWWCADPGLGSYRTDSCISCLSTN